MTQTMSAAAARKASKKTQHVRSTGDWITLVLLIVAALLVLFPLLVLTVNAFKTSADYNATGPLSLPKHFTMEGIVSFWTTTKFPLKFWNSLVISLVVAVAAVVLSVLNSFALGIGKVKGNTWIVLAIMLANMMPQEALLYPLYTVQAGGPVQHQTGDHHHLHHHSERLRNVSAFLRVRHVPAGHSGSGRNRWRLQMADSTKGGIAHLLVDHQCAVRVLLRVDLE